MAQVRPLAKGSRSNRSGRVAAWAFTGRDGGVSEPPFASLNLAGHVGDDPRAVSSNRDRAGSILALDSGALAVANAAHGAEVAEVCRPGEVEGVDGLVTMQAGLGLLALAADCVPLALMDVEHGSIAAVHCGWRGLGAGIVPQTVSRMRSRGALNLEAIIGPRVCASCYPVGADRIEELRGSADAKTAEAACLRLADGWHIDVGAGVRTQLTQLGIRCSSIDRCTFEDPELFSYRRDRVTGRHGVLVAMSTP